MEAGCEEIRKVSVNLNRRFSAASGHLELASGPPQLVASHDFDLLDDIGEGGDNLNTAGGFNNTMPEVSINIAFTKETALEGFTLNVLPPDSTVRVRLHKLLTSRRWVIAVNLLIWISTTALFFEPRKVHGSPTTSTQEALVVFDWLVVAIFLFEVLLHCVTWGFTTYLGSSMSNRMDLFALLSSVAFMTVGLHGVHALRVLKCLPHTYFPEMRSARAVFQAVERSASLLVDNIGILIFFVVFFSIGAVEFFAAGHAFSCIDNGIEVENLACSDTAHSLFPERPCPDALTCVDVGNSDPGWLNFDHFGTACISIFQVAQLENWGDIMRPLFHSRDQHFTYFFFVAVIVSCRFIIINLFIAIIVFHFQELRVEMEGEDPDTLLKHTVWNRMVRDAADILPERFTKTLQERYPLAFDASCEDVEMSPQPQNVLTTTKPVEEAKEDNAVESPDRAEELSRASEEEVIWHIRARELFLKGVVIVVIGNVALLATEHSTMNDSQKQLLIDSEYGFLAFYIIEQLVRFSLEWQFFLSKKMWWFEALLVVLGILGLAFADVRPANRLRVFRVLSFNQSATDFCQKVNVEPILSLFYMMLVAMLIFSAVGMQFFSGLYDTTKFPARTAFMDPIWVSRFHFNTIGDGLRTLFLVMAGDNWSYPMYQAMSASSDMFVPAMLYFYAFVICSNWVLLSMFIAVLLQEFDTFSPLDKNLDNHEVVTQSRSMFSKFLRKVDMLNAADGVDEENIASVCAIVNMHKWATRARTTEMQKTNFKRKIEMNKRSVANSARVMEGVRLKSSIRACILLVNDSNKKALTSKSAKMGRMRQTTLFTARQVRVTEMLKKAAQAESVVTAAVTSEEANLKKLETNKATTSETKAKLRMLATGGPSMLRELREVEVFPTLLDSSDEDDGTSSDEDLESHGSFLKSSSPKNSEKRLKKAIEAFKVAQNLEVKPESNPKTDDNVLHDEDNREEQVATKPVVRISSEETVGEKKLSMRLPRWISLRKKRHEHMLKGLALFLLHENHIIRVTALKICQSQIFIKGILASVLVSSFLLIFSPPNEAWGDAALHTSGGTLPTNVDDILSVLFLIIFTGEFLIKITAYGFIWMSKPRDPARKREEAYLMNPWNVLDFTILNVMYVSFVLEQTGAKNGFKSIRIFRVLRVIRVIRRVESLRVLLQALLHPRTLVRIGAVLLLALFCYFSFGLLAVSLLAGKLGYCTEETVMYKNNCATGTSGSDVFETADEYLAPRVWKSPWRNFDTIGDAIVTLVAVASGEDWGTPMLHAVDSTTTTSGPSKDNNAVYSLFFIVYMILMSFVIVNLVIFVITDAIRRQSGTAVLIREQVEWIDLMHYIKVAQPLPWVHPPERDEHGELTTIGAMRDVVLRYVGPKQFTKNRSFDAFINFVIIINILMMASEYRQDQMDSTHKEFLEVANTVIVSIYIAECLIRVFALSPTAYFKDKWNRFDSFIVLGSITGLALKAASLSSNAGAAKKLFSIIRIFRILRVFKMIRRSKGVAFLFDSLLASIPAISNIMLIVVLFIWIWGAIGMELFGGIRMGASVNSDFNFRGFFNAFCTLSLVITSDNWIHIMHDVMMEDPFCSRQPPPWVGSIDGGTDADLSKGFNDCGSKALSIVYFVSFFVLGAYIFLNLVTAAILDEVQHAISRNRFRVSESEIDVFRLMWCKTVQGNSSEIPRWRMAHLMESLFYHNKLGLHPIYQKKFFNTLMLKLDWFRLRGINKEIKSCDAKLQQYAIGVDKKYEHTGPSWRRYGRHQCGRRSGSTRCCTSCAITLMRCAWGKGRNSLKDVALNLEEVESTRQFQKKADRLLATQVLQV